MSKLLVADFPTVEVGEWGGGQPNFRLTSAQDYARWVSSGVPGIVVPGVSLAPPVYLGMHDDDLGGAFFFRSPDPTLPASAFEYRLAPGLENPPFGSWTTCPGFSFRVSNETYLKGNVQIRRKATGNLPPSDAISNRSDFLLHVFPMEVLSYYVENRMLHVQVRVGQENFIRIVTNGFSHPFYNSGVGNNAYPPGVYEFIHDFTLFPNSSHIILFENGPGYRTPPFYAVIPA